MIAKNDRVLLVKGTLPEKVGNIYIPQTAGAKSKVKLNVGKIVSFGPGMRLSTGEHVNGYEGSIGDLVVWEEFGDYEMTVLGEGIVAIRNEDIVAVVTESDVPGVTFENKPKE